MQHVARTAQSDAPLRPAPKDVPLAGHFSHLQGCLYWFAVAKVASGTFVRSAFDELLAGNETAQREVLHDVLRLHSSMWAAAGVSSGASSCLYALASCPRPGSGTTMCCLGTQCGRRRRCVLPVAWH